MLTLSLPLAYYLSHAEWNAKCQGSHFGVAGGCIPFPYHVLTLSLPFAYCLSHVQDGEQDVRGAILGLLAVAMNRPSRGGSPMRDRKIQFCSTRLIANPQSKLRLKIWRMLLLGLLMVAYYLLTMPLQSAYTFLTICLHIPTICLLSVPRAGWRAKCEGSHFGVAGGCPPFPYHLLTLSLPFAYCLSLVQDG